MLAVLLKHQSDDEVSDMWRQGKQDKVAEPTTAQALQAPPCGTVTHV